VGFDAGLGYTISEYSSVAFSFGGTAQSSAFSHCDDRQVTLPDAEKA
jgi:hypothetical protein